MSKDERYGTRDLTFSRWHRYALPERVKCIDVDLLEYCEHCYSPLALVEIAQDVGQPFKPTIVMRHLAAAASIPAYLVMYTLDAAAPWGISQMRIAQVYPVMESLREASREEVAAVLTAVHDKHKCQVN